MIEGEKLVANSYVQTDSSQLSAQRNFEQFLNDLAAASSRFADNEAEIYMFCHLAPENEPGRRVLVVTDKHSPIVRVCIEAAYELFAGDIHHYVQRIGTVERQETRTKLVPLVREAYERLMSWKPTHENIWDNVF